MIPKKFIIIIICLFIISCSNNDKFLQEYFKKYPGLYNKELHIELDKMKYYINNPLINSLNNKRIYIFSVIDGTCPSCFKEIKDWQINIENDYRSEKIGIFIIAIGTKPEWADKYIEEYEITIPIIEDSDVKFLSDNDLNEFGYLSFITDSEKRIKLIGNPYKNRILYPYFKKLF